MTQCDERKLSRFIDGELSADESQAISAHMETCEPCRAAHEKLLVLHKLARKVYPRQHFASPSVPKPKKRSLLPLAAAAVLLLAVGLGWAALRGGEVEETPEAPELSPVASNSVEESAAVPAQETPVAELPEAPTTDIRPAVATSREKSMPITGHVEDAQGRPIQGVRVYTTGLKWNSDNPTESRVYASTRTDRAGDFRIERDYLSHWVGFHAQGYIPEGFYIHTAVTEADLELRVRLLKAGQAHGRVLSPDGRPLPNARVFTGHYAEAEGGPKYDAYTDDQGVFTLTLNASMNGLAIWASHPDYAPVQAPVLAEGKVDDIQLKPGGALRISVMRGRLPIPGAQVSLTASKSRLMPRDRHALTDETGMVTFAGLSDGLYHARAQTPEGDYTGYSKTALLVTEGTILDGKLKVPTLSHDATLRGSIVGPDGEPFTSIPINLSRADYPDAGRSIPVDENGQFTAGIDLGETSVGIAMSLFPMFALENPMPRKINATRRGQVIEEHFQIVRREKFYEAKLINHMGEPVTRALVSTNHFNSGGGIETWINSVDGVVRFSQRPNRLSAYDPTTGMSNRSSDSIAEDQWPIELRLDTPAGSLEGVVLAENGEPLADVQVFSYAERYDVGLFGGQSNPSFRTHRGVTDAAGRFKFHPAPASLDFTIELEAPGYVLPGGQRTVTAQASETGETITIKMVQTSQHFEGSVVWADNVPATGPRIMVARDGEESKRFYTDPDGNFSIDVPPGQYSIHAFDKKTGVSSVPLRLSATRSDILLVFPEVSAFTDTEPPAGDLYQIANNNLKQVGLSFKMFANEARGERFPPLSTEYGKLRPKLNSIYPEYMPSTEFLAMFRGETDIQWVYTGYVLNNETVGQTFLDAYEEYGPAAISGQDVKVAEGYGNADSSTIYLLREGIERYLITDINDPNAGSVGQSKIPIVWELPGSHEVAGGWVLYLDGHTEWVDYPGRFPMTESFTERLRGIMVD